jgi:hypothetical protein
MLKGRRWRWGLKIKGEEMQEGLKNQNREDPDSYREEVGFRRL